MQIGAFIGTYCTDVSRSGKKGFGRVGEVEPDGPNTDPLDVLLAAVGNYGAALTDEQAVELWSTIGDAEDSALDDFLAVLVGQGDPTWTDAAVLPDDAYALRLGRWSLDLSRAGVRSVVLSSLIAAGLAHRGWGEFGVAFLTAVIPTVLDIERVELSAKDRLLLADLRLKPRTQQFFYDPDVLCAELPPEGRLGVNRCDFGDLGERWRAAGEAENGPADRIRSLRAR